MRRHLDFVRSASPALCCCCWRYPCCSVRCDDFPSIYDSIHQSAASILQMKSYCVRCNLFIHSRTRILPETREPGVAIESRSNFPECAKSCVIFPVDTHSGCCSCGSRNFRYFGNRKMRVGWHLSLPLPPKENLCPYSTTNKCGIVGSCCHVSQSLSMDLNIEYIDFPTEISAFWHYCWYQIDGTKTKKKTKITIHSAFVCLPTKCFQFLFFGWDDFNWFSLSVRIFVCEMGKWNDK